MNAKGAIRTAAMLAVTLALAGGCSKNGGSGTYQPTPTPGKELSSGNIGSGGNYAHTFAAAGNFPYHCGLHPSVMFGARVVVSDTAAATSAAVQIVSVSTPGFSPATVSIKTGGTVTWTNIDGMTHSVESD